MFKHIFTLLLAGLFTSNAYSQAPLCGQSLQLNQIQVLGSHNSYRKSMDKGVKFFMGIVDRIKPDLDIRSLDYTHAPLEEQLDSFNLRSFEIDIYNDPEGGRFYNRFGNRLSLKNKASREEKLKKPGMKVMHIPDIDYNTRYLTFKDALTTLKAWSDTHKDHMPIFILVETKDETIGDHLKRGKMFAKTAQWDASACDSIDAEIDAVFGKNSAQVFTPDELRGNYTTLEDAVRAGNWPLLKNSLGKIIFVMMGGAKKSYVDGHESLKGRNMFIFSDPGKPECAFIKMDNSVGNKAEIQKLAAEGYMIRTRADAGTVEARNCDYTSCSAAFAGGAQIISTDYYKPDYRHARKPKKWSNYQVKMRGKNAARVSPAFDIPCKGRGLKEEAREYTKPD